MADSENPCVFCKERKKYPYAPQVNLALITKKDTSMGIPQNLMTIGSLIAVILTLIVKLRWGKEFEKAKNTTFKAKDAQIAVLER